MTILNAAGISASVEQLVHYSPHGTSHNKPLDRPGFGNHDGGNLTNEVGECNVVRHGIRQRNRHVTRNLTHLSHHLQSQILGFCGVALTWNLSDNRLRATLLTAVSTNGLHYSWDFGSLHLVHLNLYPGLEHEFAQEWQHGTWQYPGGRHIRMS